jgi:hypothetical protein
MDVNAGSAVTLFLGTLSIASVHALIPSHWLAFAVVGRTQGWSMRRTLLTALLAGTGHVLLTIILGFATAGVGKALLEAIPHQAENAAKAGALLLLGGYYISASLRGKSACGHDHSHEAEGEELPSSVSRRMRSSTVIGALVMGMTLSPCLDLLTIYVAASSFPWHIVALISLVMSITTLLLMTLLVWLAMQGLHRVRFHWLENNEGPVMGGILIALGGLLFFL